MREKEALVLPLYEHPHEYAWYAYLPATIRGTISNWTTGGIASLANAVAIH